MMQEDEPSALVKAINFKLSVLSPASSCSITLFFPFGGASASMGKTHVTRVLLPTSRAAGISDSLIHPDSTPAFVHSLTHSLVQFTSIHPRG
mmetsp:Transcript_21565/g.42855  ORF Transcript_21565/g.42855 Transcript_21565/m.42855 type:complete len:92 (+) Transcript_21565:113-388(+)